MAVRRELMVELQPLVTTFEGHPWNWAAHEQGERTPRKNETSRWNAGKDLSFVPLRPERVVEVRYDYMEGARFRHTAQFVRWRPDRGAGVLHLRAARTAGRVPASPTSSPAS
jgi:ATP-dependent DNA ligase